MKIFSLPSGSGAEDAERFSAAVEILAAYDHPHWLNVFDGGTEEDLAWLAMEWLPAGSLAQRGQMGGAEALQAAVQIADALAAAHECGLDHRNLQLGECLLADPHTVKVSGFAEAVFYERAAHDLGTVRGRLACAPPERLFGEEDDLQGEIYALGAILFQMLAGELPYAGETVPEFFMDRLGGPPLRLPDSSGAIRKSTSALVERMMAINPGERFSSWSEVAAALRNELEAISESGAPVSVHPPPVPVRAALRVAKAPAYSATGGAWFTILMLAGIVGFAGWFGWKHFYAPPVERSEPAPKIAALPTPPPSPFPPLLPTRQPRRPRRPRRRSRDAGRSVTGAAKVRSSQDGLVRLEKVRPRIAQAAGNRHREKTTSFPEAEHCGSGATIPACREGTMKTFSTHARSRATGRSPRASAQTAARPGSSRERASAASAPAWASPSTRMAKSTRWSAPRPPRG